VADEIDDLVRKQNLISSVELAWEQSGILTLDEAYKRYLIGGREPKLLRMLRALWRVKDA
jgi:hypothetical protein